MNLGMVLVILVGAYRVSSGYSEAGKIIAFASYFTIISNAMMAVSRIFVMFSKGLASSRRILEVIDTPYEETHGDFDTYDRLQPAIEFDAVSFSYLGNKDNVADISFTINKGETLGIIGPTGSGKSTLIQLLLRLYKPQKGTISVYGHDIQTYDAQYNQLFGLVHQHDFVFQSTLGENIRFGRSFDDAAILEAMKNAQASEFVSRLPKGLEAPIASKGTNVSGGQRQRILISRALVSSPDILILDDSSSALDYQTDAKLRNALKTQYRGVTKVMVAQRIASILNADTILVMKDGRILDVGTHETLLKRCDLYNEIYDTQMGGMIDD
ncbi:hypothetical protein AOC36_02215 [Erysipelothrix larvae]|uniref:ABC transporter domain-containing protein n=1 Tax=Erysipelothrix larvae TaxID=1514105 RepID=A0A0X8GYN8_9FIRM|nr:ABC transporter ATP-binding protein [Erysipelothrix larvae]AMC92840.1 hypothetical protein AOC36_02215 [Erysipelothrix larvae]